MNPKNTIKILRYLFLFFLQSFFVFAYSQKQNIKFEHLDINDGLSQNHILCILQDSRGFMWFGTRDGLNKYDGYKFTIYKNNAKDKNSISNNFVSAITEDSKGIIWIATRGGGLNRYDREKDQFTNFIKDAKNINSITSNLLDGITKDENDNLWISTEDGGLDCFEQNNLRFLHYRHNKNDNNTITDDNTRTVYAGTDHNLWIGTYSGGLNYFNRRTKKITSYVHDDNNSSSISNNNVRVIFEDSRHRIWIGTIGGGLDLFEKSTGTFRHFTNDIHKKNSISANVVSSLGEDNDGNILIGTENGGLNVFDPLTEIFHHYKHDEIDNKSISQNSIYSIYKDANGNIWVGTFAGGVNIISKNASRFTQYYHTSDKNSLSHNNVLCIAENAEGKIWIGTDGGGVNLFDPVTKNFTHYLHEEGNKNSICGNYILNVCNDSKGNLWVGTWADGITVFNPQQNTYKHFKNDPHNPSSLSNNNAWAIFEDRDKNIWVGTYGGGLNLYNPSNNSFTHYDDTTSSVVVKQIYSVTEDANGNLLIGTDGGGLRIFNKKTKNFTSLVHNENKNSLSDNRINYIYKDGHDNFWINTMSGLNYYEPGKNKFSIYTTADGLPNNVIFGTLEDKNGSLWISTNKGLSQFNPHTKKFKNFTPADGLQSYEFKAHSAYKARSGAMYFGGINGFNEFYPDKVEEDSFEPYLVFTDFEIFNKKIFIARDSNDPSPLKKDISETKEITLPYEMAVISFEFASLNYSAKDKKQYSYILEGFEKEWNDIGTKHSVTYTNLNPGTYTLKVRGLNNNGTASTHTTEIKITITPPFWMTWWFRLIILICLIAAGFAFLKFRINIVTMQKAKLQQKVNEQTSQLIKSTQQEQKARQESEKAKQQTEQANKELEQKNKELEQFAYVASHDMQEPLRTTSSFVELLQKQYKGKLDDKADKYLTYISESSDRMKILIKDLLDYSRIGRKKEWEPVDTNMVLADVVADLGAAINESSAKINGDPLPIINGHYTEIKQLFQNLVMNAVKFRKKNTAPDIQIHVAKTNGFWQFDFCDNGIGIEAQYRERVFIIFQRLHTRTEYEGSGIGLAHCKKIVELHGGKIWIESIAGEGTTIHFTIPENNN